MPNLPLPTWCPGCGNFGIWASLKQAIEKSNIPLEQFVIAYDIGCSGNMSSFIKANAIHGLHGRAIPLAKGIKFGNPNLKVIVVVGDGGLLGEGLSHFLHAARANINLTVLLHNNQTYSLTTGQSSPTALVGSTGKSVPEKVSDKPLEPVSLALLTGSTFVARAFAPDIPNTADTISTAVNHAGFSFIDILQPCVTYNKLNTAAWFKEKLKNLSQIPTTEKEALDLAKWSDTTIYQGIFRQTA